MYLTRNVQEKIINLSKSYKVVLITSPRQVGKKTMLKEIKEENRNYISLNELNLMSLAKNDPKLFLQRYRAPLIIDEIQYAPELLPYIKSLVDNSDEKGQYWLTGSQQFHLMKNVTESLAGRIGIIDMFPLSIREKKQMPIKKFEPSNISKDLELNVNDIFKEIFMGGMPDYYINGLDREVYFNNYVRTYIERDVRDLTQVGDLNSFYKFLVSVASRTGEILNYASIALDAGVSVNTIKNWISILEASNIIYLLEPYNNSELKRAVKNPKIYFLDTGLCSYLCKWSSYETLMDSSISGHYLETFVISELIKNYRSLNENIGLYFYRDKDGKEIDLVLYKDETLFPFEIKKTASPNKEMIKNFAILEKTNKKIGPGGVICLYPEVLPLDQNNNVIPICSMF